VILTSKVNTEEVTPRRRRRTLLPIISKIREMQAEVLRVAKSSTNLRRTHQNLLNIAAGYTVGLIDALRIRIDRIQDISGQEEIQALKREQESLRKNMVERVNGMEEALQKVFLTAELEKQKADHHLNLLIETTREKEELLRQLIDVTILPNPLIHSIKTRDKTIQCK